MIGLVVGKSVFGGNIGVVIGGVIGGGVGVVIEECK